MLAAASEPDHALDNPKEVRTTSILSESHPSPGRQVSARCCADDFGCAGVVGDGAVVERDEIVAWRGQEIYDHIEANLHYEAFLFLGKLEPTIHLLRKA